MLSNHPKFTVHNYSIDTTSNTDLLVAARHWLSSIDSQWVTITLPANKKVPSILSTQYVYKDKPPTALSLTGANEERTIVVRKEWGTSPDKAEIFHLKSLEDFVQTDLSSLFRVTDVSSYQLASETEEPPRKRQKAYNGSLYEFIDKPHIIPSPLVSSNPPIKAIAYRKTVPIPIPPRTLPLPSFSDFDRSAWSIPIRGILPWENCSSGNVLDNSDCLPIPPNPHESNVILWTRASLVSFWNYLLKLQNAGTLGPLGLSFYVSESYRPPDLNRQRLTGTDSSAQVQAQTGTGGSSGEQISRSPLSSVDHIKIYHEATKTMYVRNALDIWSFVSIQHNNSEKIRLLKGARLVLVDERSKGILIS